MEPVAMKAMAASMRAEARLTKLRERMMARA